MALLPPCCLLRTGMLRLCIYQRPHKCRRAFTHKMNRPLHHTVSRRQCCRRAFASKMRRHRTLLHLRAAGVIARSPRNALLAVSLCIRTFTAQFLPAQNTIQNRGWRAQGSVHNVHISLVIARLSSLTPTTKARTRQRPQHPQSSNATSLLACVAHLGKHTRLLIFSRHLCTPLSSNHSVATSGAAQLNSPHAKQTPPHFPGSLFCPVFAKPSHDHFSGRQTGPSTRKNVQHCALHNFLRTSLPILRSRNSAHFSASLPSTLPLSRSTYRAFGHSSTLPQSRSCVNKGDEDTKQ